MPSTVETLLNAAGLTLAETVRWGSAPSVATPGIYIVAMDATPCQRNAVQTTAPIAPDAIASLLETRPELRVDGVRPKPGVLAARIASFWLPDETVVYAGLASSSVADRVKQYYRTPLGARAPHAGGWFLKTLTNLDDLYVHCAPANDYSGAESLILQTFVAGVSESARGSSGDPQRPFPFANLEWPKGVRKMHGITGARAAR